MVRADLKRLSPGASPAVNSSELLWRFLHQQVPFCVGERFGTPHRGLTFANLDFSI
jgi:hypothetical protein